MPRWRPPRLGALVRAALPGAREVYAQVAPYARAWEEANARTLAAEGPLWVVLGDSTAQGIGAPAYDLGYVGQLHDLLQVARAAPQRGGAEGAEIPWRVLNLSKSGARAADVIATQLPRLVALAEAGQGPPSLVTCAIGANDLFPTSLPMLRRQLATIMSRLPAGAVIATLPQGLRPARARILNEMIRTDAPAAQLVVADVWAHTGPPWDGKLAADHFHPGLTGYAHWTRAFADALGLDAPP